MTTTCDNVTFTQQTHKSVCIAYGVLKPTAHQCHNYKADTDLHPAAAFHASKAHLHRAGALAAGGVPQPDLAVSTTAGQQPAVGAPGNGPDLAHVALQVDVTGKQR